MACNNVTCKVFSQPIFSVTSSIVSSLYIDMPWENCIFIANFYNNYWHFCRISHRFLEAVTVPVANFRGQVKVRSTSALCKANDRVLVWFLIIQRNIWLTIYSVAHSKCLRKPCLNNLARKFVIEIIHLQVLLLNYPGSSLQELISLWRFTTTEILKWVILYFVLFWKKIFYHFVSIFHT